MKVIINVAVLLCIVISTTAQKTEFKEPALPIDSATKTITYSKVLAIQKSVSPVTTSD